MERERVCMLCGVGLGYLGINCHYLSPVKSASNRGMYKNVEMSWDVKVAEHRRWKAHTDFFIYKSIFGKPLSCSSSLLNLNYWKYNVCSQATLRLAIPKVRTEPGENIVTHNIFQTICDIFDHFNVTLMLCYVLQKKYQKSLNLSVPIPFPRSWPLLFAGRE